MSEKEYPKVVMPQCPIEKILKGQKALVTGGSSGIGKAVAIALGHAGADVVVNYVRGADQAQEVVAAIEQCGSRALACQADVSQEDQVSAMFAKIIAELGTIDILINNAGLQQDAPFDEMTIAQWNRVINVNLTGQFLCAREAVREFKRRGVVPEISVTARRYIDLYRKLLGYPVIIRTAEEKKGKTMTNKKQDDKEASFDGRDLEKLTNPVKGFLDIQDRTYGISPKKYAMCFVGSEAVETLVREGIANDETDALRIGNMMLNAGVFHHVQHAHPFENKYLFYRFTADEDHGKIARNPDGSAVRWADFIAPLTSSDDQGLRLQPSVPERDPDLAGMAQENLEACGVSPLDEHNTTFLDLLHPKAWVDPTPKPSYNLVVIGAGAGGLVSAVRQASQFGVKIDGDISVDFPYVMERLRRLRASIAPVDSAERYAKQLGVDLFIGKGAFTGNHRIEVNGKSLNFAKAVVATGGHSQYSGSQGSALSNQCNRIQFDRAASAVGSHRCRPHRDRAGPGLPALRFAGIGLFAQRRHSTQRRSGRGCDCGKRAASGRGHFCLPCHLPRRREPKWKTAGDPRFRPGQSGTKTGICRCRPRHCRR